MSMSTDMSIGIHHNDCVICLQGAIEEIIIRTSCCSKSTHQTCLNLWLNERNGRGMCPYCRAQLRPSLHILDGTMIPWDPLGYIHITTGTGQCDIELQSLSPLVLGLEPVIHKCLYHEMEKHITDNFITSGHLIILTNEEGNYFDAVNIPVGWVVRVRPFLMTQ